MSLDICRNNIEISFTLAERKYFLIIWMKSCSFADMNYPDEAGVERARTNQRPAGGHVRSAGQWGGAVARLGLNKFNEAQSSYNQMQTWSIVTKLCSNQLTTISNFPRISLHKINSEYLTSKSIGEPEWWRRGLWLPRVCRYSPRTRYRRQIRGRVSEANL